MKSQLRSGWPAIVLSALFVAGCGGGKSAPKSQAAPTPPAPAPPTPAPAAATPVAWGEAADGLQIGLSAAGGSFEPRSEMSFTVHLRNAGDEKLALFDGEWRGSWGMIFTPKAGGIPRSASRLVHDDHDPRDLDIPAGGETTLGLSVDCVSYLFEDARLHQVPAGPVPEDSPWYNFKPAEDLNSLPPGRYMVTAGYVHARESVRPEACHCWHGRVTTGAVEIEIRPEAGADAQSEAAKAVWGQAVEGLRAGLAGVSDKRGDWDRGLCKRCQDFGAAALDANITTKTCPLCRKNEYVAPLQTMCSSCAARRQVCSGCGQPCPWIFEEGRPLEFQVHLRNQADKDLTLNDAAHVGCWRFVFAPAGGGPTLQARYWVREDRAGRPLSILKGQSVACAMRLDADHKYEIFGADRRLDSLPAGKYVVTASYQHAQHPQTELCPYWHGKVATGAVEIEIKPKGAAAAPAAPAGPKISEARAGEIAVKAAADSEWRMETRVVSANIVREGTWFVVVGDYRTPKCVSIAEVEIDAGTGQVTAFKFRPGK